MKKFLFFVLGVLFTSAAAYGTYTYYSDDWYALQKAKDPDSKIIQTEKQRLEEPLFYSLDDSILPIGVTKEAKKFSDTWTAVSLKSHADKCQEVPDQTRFDRIAELFADTTYYLYTFKAKADSTGTFEVAMLPNKPEYVEFTDFNTDFAFCEEGGLYPARFNKTWLMFKSSCPAEQTIEDPLSGYAVIGGVTCQQIRDLVEDSLEFN